ncbi:MAG: nuclear transport factor 2 family protein [Omnitrophica WOR_2 bacterium]
MKIRLLSTMTLVLGLLMLAACASAPAKANLSNTSSQISSNSLPKTGLDRVAVVRAYVSKENTGDFQKTLAFYADDAVVDAPVGLFIGKQEIAMFLEKDVKTTRATPEKTYVDGPFVIDTGTVSLARFIQAGIGPTSYRTEYIIDNAGKIRFFTPATLLTPEQEVKWKAVLAKTGQPAAQAVNPIDVAKAYVQTANSGDFEKSLAYYADDSAALVQNGSLLLVGKQQIANWLQTDVLTTRAAPQDWQIQGNMVINTGTVSLARFKSLGIGSVQYRAIYIIQDGKIRFFRPIPILTPEQQEKIQSAQVTSSPAH